MNLNDPDRRYKKGFLAYNRCDFEAALAVWKPMAKQGHAGAQYMLGFMYDNGEGVQCNLKKAADWYRLAAEQDDMLAQNSLGSMYESGEGVPENPSRAVDWYLMAAKKTAPFHSMLWACFTCVVRV